MWSGLIANIKFYSYLFREILGPESWRHLSLCDVLLVRHDHNLGYTFEEKPYAQLTDSIGDLLISHGLTVRSVAIPYSKLAGKRAYGSPASFNSSFFFIEKMGIIIGYFKGKTIGKKWMERHKEKLWCSILEKTKPVCVIGIQPDKYLCRAGKDKNIHVYDLQHGVISKGDHYYIPVEGTLNPVEDFPDGFLCWDEQSQNALIKLIRNTQIRILKTGNPWFLRFAESKPDDILVKRAVEEIKFPQDLPPSIIVSLQYDLEVWHSDRNNSGLLVNALQTTIRDTIDKYNWILRIHPVQLRGRTREKTINDLRSIFGDDKTAQWLKASEIPLPIVLANADLHITNESAVVIEAGWMGVRSIILSDQIAPGKKHQDLYLYERDIGMAEVLPQDPEFIKRKIIEMIALGRGPSSIKDSGLVLNAFVTEIVLKKAEINRSSIS